jgi:hypothetical protein
MRRTRAWLGVAAALLCIGFARLQDAPADVPSGPATIRGRVVHAQRPDSVPGTTVVLYALGEQGRSGVRSTHADDEGRFVFESVPNDPHSVYLVSARSGEIPFIARVVFATGELEREVELSLSDTSSDTSQMSVGAARVQISLGCSLLSIRQAHTLHNGSDAVIYVPEGDRGKATPLLSVEMPAGASGFETALGEQGLDFADRTMRYWGPLYPGEQEIEFSYGVPQAGDLSLAIGFASGAADVRILTSLEGVRANGSALEPVVVAAHGAEHTLLGHTVGALRPGESLALSVALPASTPTQRLQTRETRIVLELDDAALDVQEQHEIRVAGEDRLTSAASAPLLCIPLPDQAQGLRFTSGARELGLARDASGALALHGPLPAGESILAMRYLVPVAGEPVRLERSFLTPLPRLSVLITDTGVIPESDRLHSLQPVRTEDRSYLQLEGLAIEAGETVALNLRRLSPRRGLPPVATAGLVLIAAAGALAFLISPLRSDRGAEREEPVLSPAALEREAVMRSLLDLDEDFETGKLEAEDHVRLRDELRARAVALLRAERRAEAPAEPRAAAAERCPGCDGAVRAGDRFCSTCGTRLVAPRANGDTGQ